MTYGRGDGERGVDGGEVIALMERRISREVVGVSILRREEAKAERILLSIPTIIRLRVQTKWRRFDDWHTLEATRLNSNKLLFHAFA